MTWKQRAMLCVVILAILAGPVAMLFAAKSTGDSYRQHYKQWIEQPVIVVRSV